MQTRSLKSLVQISQVGSFAKAAEQLNMTLSALSMQIKALELELGVNLFDRSVRPPRLTPIGRSILDEAIPLLRSEESLLTICRSNDTLIGRFRIGFVTTAAVRFLPRFLEQAQLKAPQATFEIETGLSKALELKVLNGQIDAAIVTDAGSLPEALSEIVIQEEPFVFAAHESILADELKEILKNRPFFHFMADTGIGKLITNEMLGYGRPRGARTVVLDNLEAIMECVAAGLGFTLLPQPDVERYRTKCVKMIPSPKPFHRKLVLATARDGTFASRDRSLAALLGVETATR